MGAVRLQNNPPRLENDPPRLQKSRDVIDRQALATSEVIDGRRSLHSGGGPVDNYKSIDE